MYAAVLRRRRLLISDEFVDAFEISQPENRLERVQQEPDSQYSTGRIANYAHRNCTSRAPMHQDRSKLNESHMKHPQHAGSAGHSLRARAPLQTARKNHCTDEAGLISPLDHEPPRAASWSSRPAFRYSDRSTVSRSQITEQSTRLQIMVTVRRCERGAISAHA
jgi:hypothetical protein